MWRVCDMLCLILSVCGLKEPSIQLLFYVNPLCKSIYPSLLITQ